MTINSFIIRGAVADDIAAIESIQRECYPAEYHETAETFLNKIKQSPEFCLVAVNSQEQVLGYFMCLLASLERFPCLNMHDYIAPTSPSILYLHDMALTAMARGRGVRQAFLKEIFYKARQLPSLRASYLIAVQGAEIVWQKEGFKAVNAESLGLATQLQTYGTTAILMSREIM